MCVMQILARFIMNNLKVKQVMFSVLGKLFFLKFPSMFGTNKVNAPPKSNINTLKSSTLTQCCVKDFTNDLTPFTIVDWTTGPV